MVCNFGFDLMIYSKYNTFTIYTIHYLPFLEGPLLDRHPQMALQTCTS